MNEPHYESVFGIRALRIALVGTGALGSKVAEQLIRAGVERVLLVDPQRIASENLATSPPLQRALDSWNGDPDTLPYKVDLLIAQAQQCGLSKWQALPVEIADAGWQRLQAFDVLCCCTDSVLSRAETAYIARTLGKPMLEAGVAGEGRPLCRVAWFPPGSSAACYLCGIRESRRAQILAMAASVSLGCSPLPDAASMTGAATAITYAAEGVLKHLHHFIEGALPGEVRLSRCEITTFEDGTRWREQPVPLAQSETCPWHEPPSGELVALPDASPIEEHLHALGRYDQVVQLAWPVCTLARCHVCGKEVSPMQRLLLVRQGLSCPDCGALGALEPLQAVEVLQKGDPLRMRTPRQLGQPVQHLYLLRQAIRYSGMTSPGEGAQ